MSTDKTTIIGFLFGLAIGISLPLLQALLFGSMPLLGIVATSAISILAGVYLLGEGWGG